MSRLQRIYDNSPIWFQNVMVSAKGYQNQGHRYGRKYWEFREFHREFDTWSLERKVEYQNEQLRKFINYAATHSKFYRELYEGIDLFRIKTTEDLKLLPIVDKEMLREHIEDVITIPRKGALEGHTGGTTGKSLVVLNTVEDVMARMALLDHFKARVGFEHRKMKRATFNGKHIVPPNQIKKVFWRYNHSCKQMIYSSFHLSEQNMQAYVKSLNAYKPKSIDGFFTSMCDVASYIERNKIELTFKPIAIFPTSETVTQTGKELLERVFKCPVYNQYASSEGAPFVTECAEHHLHIEHASGVFEHFEDSNEILVTSFSTHGTPLIRYRIGDSMVFSNKRCSCGDDSLLVEEIQGRSLDFLYTSEGAKINGGNVANLFKNMPNSIIRAQLIQENIGEIKILLEIDKERYKPEFDGLLKDEFEHKFGLGTKITIEHVDEIPREKSGKHRFIKNLISSNS